MGTANQQKNSVAAYVRETNGFGLTADDQIGVVKNYIGQHGIHAEVKFFKDAGDDCPSYDELLSSLRLHKHDFLICSSVDRLDEIFDSLEESVRFLGELETLGVRFISVAENFDASNLTRPFGTLDQLVSAAKITLKSERTRLGVDRARKTGKTIGRPSKQHDDDVNRLRKEGVPIRKIAQHLGISTSTVQAALHRNS